MSSSARRCVVGLGSAGVVGRVPRSSIDPDGFNPTPDRLTHETHKTYQPQKRKALLRDISMHVGPGELCYLIGPSGAGKTTLLEVLAGRVQMGASIFLDRLIDRPAC